MKQKPRIYCTESQKAVMWDRWKQGDSLQMIAQMFDRNHSSAIAGCTWVVCRQIRDSGLLQKQRASCFGP